MDKNKKYFYITIHFSPKYKDTIFTHVKGDLYRHEKTGELFRERLMYDCGWGQENGFERLPQLTFNELIELVTSCNIKINYDFDNIVGAVSVIMQDHIEELIDFLSEQINTDYFTNSIIRENYKWFAFSTEKTWEIGKIPGGILTQSYEDVLNQYPKWREISSQVIEKIYT